jgi:hypothetical protein
MIPLKIMRLANGENLPLPAYETHGAAGMISRSRIYCPKTWRALSDSNGICHCPS